MKLRKKPSTSLEFSELIFSQAIISRVEDVKPFFWSEIALSES